MIYAHALSNNILTFQSNTNTPIMNNGANNQNSDAETSDVMDENAILAQLNQLRQWQESQRQVLLSSQLDQQRMLEWEKQQLYQMLGVNSTHEENGSPDDTQFVGVDNDDNEELNDTDKTIPTHDDDLRTPSHDRRDPSAPMQMELQSPSINQLNKIIANLATNTACQLKPETNNHTNIPKRRYLKRGEGLTNRFKMPPDAFRLDKLPKYKYVQRVPKHAQPALQNRDKQRHKLNAKCDTKSTNDNDDDGGGDDADDVGEVITSEGRQHIIGAQSLQSYQTSQQASVDLNIRKNIKGKNVSQLKLRPTSTANTQQLQPHNLGRDVNAVQTNSEQGMLMNSLRSIRKLVR